MRKTFLLLSGLALFALSALWYFQLAPYLTLRLPRGWSWESEFAGILTYADQKTGQFPPGDTTTLYRRSIRMASEAEWPRAVTVEDAYVVLDPLNPRKKIWEYIARETVDPQTGAYREPAYRGQYLVFPRQVGKKTYVLRSNYLEGIPVAFERQEELAGLSTYIFAYRGRAEYTKSYSGTAEFPGVQVKPGQEIKCADDQYSLRLWVEPVTGETLKIQESCYSGDSVYDVATGKLLYPVARWAGESAGDDVLAQVSRSQAERRRYFLINRYIPSFLLLLASLCVGVGLGQHRKPTNREPQS